MRMRKLSREGKGGTPDQTAAGISEGDIERPYMKLPKAHLGRPAVHDLLASLCEQHSAEASIGIIAAGGDGDMLCRPVMCWPPCVSSC